MWAHADKHSFSNFEVSPRVAVVYAPTGSDTLKAIYSRSNLLLYAHIIKKSRDQGQDELSTETLDNIELRYERVHRSRWILGLSGYYQSITATGFDLVALNSVVVGEQTQAGVEAELSFRGKQGQFSISHQYHKLIDFKLGSTAKSTFVTAAPFGFGNDLDSWSNHTTKLDFTIALNSRWRTNGNMQYLWGI